MITDTIDYFKQHPDWMLFGVLMYLQIMMFSMYATL